MHADDTIILSTSRKQFIDKCNNMALYFKENRLSLNIGKSGYMIIGKGNVKRETLQLKNGKLDYKENYNYLGYELTDSGNIRNDFNRHFNNRRSNTSIKFLNFCNLNFLAPLSIKLKVLNACIKSTYLYSCEIWGKLNVQPMEVEYRKSLRAALSIRKSVNNEIAYIESGQYPLECEIKSRQLKFWQSMKNYAFENQQSYFNRILTTAIDMNIPYITYYQHLENTHHTPRSCFENIKLQYHHSWKNKINNSFIIDREAKLSVYKSLNHDLKPYFGEDIPEFERVLITRYRCGSHSLKIEKGRYDRIERNMRLCTCQSVQTLQHVVLECPHTKRIENVTSLKEFFELDNYTIYSFLNSLTKTFKL